MVPLKYDLKVYRGDAYDQSWRLRERVVDADGNVTAGDPLDLTGCTVAAQIRADADATDPIASFACTVSTTDPGVVSISLTSAQTTPLAFEKALWDLQVTWPDTKPRTYLRGNVFLLKDVTR